MRGTISRKGFFLLEIECPLVERPLYYHINITKAIQLNNSNIKKIDLFFFFFEIEKV